jgi:hypothetical protein
MTKWFVFLVRGVALIAIGVLLFRGYSNADRSDWSIKLLNEKLAMPTYPDAQDITKSVTAEGDEDEMEYHTLGVMTFSTRDSIDRVLNFYGDSLPNQVTTIK